ncbi:phosphoenolpyruvate--protein phosphotransferase [Algihabitans albus]|uniref:phosphoenolpyruvate--protein phosphotransferase n=1 Tax=Algihabitans albus TaxID=2164067 RepID=UPI000E5D9615|nr:phosphoenolpyruvate--protein phosphotransferase [Algihabitans albus]
MKTEPGKANSSKRTAKTETKERVFEGLGVSPGVAIGPAHLREGEVARVPEYGVAAAKVAAEVQRLEKAIEKAVRQLQKIRSKSAGFHGTSGEELGYLLEAHLQMLSSRRLREGVIARIAKRLNAEAAVAREIESIAAAFAELDDPYLRSRASEIREVGQRILRNLNQRGFSGFGDLNIGSVVVAEEITPADTALMDPAKVAGFACALGGAEGHTAIMARSLGLPAVLGTPGIVGGVDPGSPVILDGSEGLVIVNPTKKRLAFYRKRQAEQAKEVKALARLRKLPAETKDGTRIQLQANLELPREVGQATAVGAEGVGLLRTEFLYMNRNDLPDEEEQTDVLSGMVAGLAGKTVTIRTLDIGGEKLASSLGGHLGACANPALGVRAIRLSLRAPELLETQLAAILRAGAAGPIRILLPLITSVEELRETRTILLKVWRRLKRRKVRMAKVLPPLGVMIEVPGAALSADALAREADFFAVGTNDLIMYTLAIDRGEEQVAHLYNPLHPAVFRLIHFAVDAGLRAGKSVSVCGEIAGDPRYTALLIGLGVRELSMGPKALARVKDRVRKLDAAAAARLASEISMLSDAAEIARLLDFFNERI